MRIADWQFTMNKIDVRGRGIEYVLYNIGE